MIKLLSFFIGGIFLFFQIGENNTFASNIYPYGISAIITERSVSQEFIEVEWQEWKKIYITSDGAPVGERIKRDSPTGYDTVSEGLGYGMLLSVYLDDQDTFDDLYQYVKYYKNENGLMAWHISSSGDVLDSNDATDADQDIVVSLIFAAKKWEHSSLFNYTNEAVEYLENLYNGTIENGSFVVKPGSQWGGSDVLNPSYFSPAWYRIYDQFLVSLKSQGINNTYVESYNREWNSVIDRVYEVLKNINNYNNGTGLVPDWTNIQGTATSKSYNYTYDAVRMPWRLSVDYSWFGDERSKDQLMKLFNFFQKVGIKNVKDGYSIDGSLIGQWHNSTFVSMSAVPVVVDEDIDLLQQFYEEVISVKSDTSGYHYYGNTLRLLSLLYLSGEFQNIYNGITLSTSNTSSLINTDTENDTTVFTEYGVDESGEGCSIIVKEGVNGNNTDIHAGDIICIASGTYSSSFFFTYLTGTQNNPIIITPVPDGEVVINVSDGVGINIEKSKNVRVSGDISGNGSKNLRITQANNKGVRIPTGSENIEIDHIEVTGVTFLNKSAAGIWVGEDGPFSGVSIHDNYIHHVGAEGIYIGNSNYYSTQYKTTDVRVYNNSIEYIGWDGIQVGAARENCSIYKNTIIGDSQADNSSQNTGININPGSDCDIYQNTIKDGKGTGIQFNQVKGGGIYNNLIVRPGKNASQGERGIQINNNTYEIPEEIVIYNNTIIYPSKDGIGYFDNNAVPYQIENNIILGAGGTAVSGISRSNGTVDSNITTGIISNFGFVNLDEDNFSLSAQATSAIDKGRNQNLSFDLLGNNRDNNIDIGAYEYIQGSSSLDSSTTLGTTQTEDTETIEDYFIDIQNHWARDYINEYAKKGVVSGYDGNIYLPDNFINRAESMKIALSVFNIDIISQKLSFIDIDTSAWYFPYISTAFLNGIVKGFDDNTVRPGTFITRAEALAIVLRTSKYSSDFSDVDFQNLFSDVTADDWYAKMVIWAAHKNVITFYNRGNFYPNAFITRAEFLAILSRVESL